MTFEEWYRSLPSEMDERSRFGGNRRFNERPIQATFAAMEAGPSPMQAAHREQQIAEWVRDRVAEIRTDRWEREHSD